MSYVDFFAGAVPQWSFAATAAPETVPVADDRREHPRHRLDQHPVVVVCSGGLLKAEMLDLSVSGSKLRLLTGLAPNAGEEVSIRLADGVVRRGAVAWVDQQTIGVSLRRPEPASSLS